MTPTGPWCVLAYVPTYLLCHSRAESVADHDSDAFSDWRPCAADTQDDTEDPPDLALADANFEKQTNGLGAQSDDAGAFQMPSDLPLRRRTLSLVTHGDDC